MTRSHTRMSSKVIQKYFNNQFEIMEYQGHSPLKSSSGVLKAKRNFLICKGSPRTNKCSLMLVLRFNLYLIIPKKAVHKGKNLASCTLIQNMINEWCGKVIFRTCPVQVSKVSSYSDGYLLLINQNRVGYPFSQGN